MKKAYIMIAAVVLVASATGIAVANIGNNGFFNPEKHQVMLEKKAEMLGIDIDALQAKMQEGQTLRDIFENEGVTKEEFMAKKLEWMEQKLAAAVEDGRMTQEQADAKLASIQERMGNCSHDFDGSGKVGAEKIGIGKIHAGRMGRGMTRPFFAE